jgi:DNA-binding Lrp family transcriptional regulator
VANDVRPLDDVDLTLLTLLQRDGRTPNKTLAEKVGIAPSTCLGRIRHLREIGAVRGIHAEVDPAWIGRPVQAMIAVRLAADSRAATESFAHSLAGVPGVLNVYFVSGSWDYLVHVAADGTDGLRDIIVDELSSRPMVANTETHLIFEHVRGALEALPLREPPRSRAARRTPRLDAQPGARPEATAR